MMVVFANCQAMTTQAPSISTVTTDPVALGNVDRATCEFQAHYLWEQAGPTTVSYQIQTSNDGVNFVNVGGASASLNASGIRTDTFSGVIGAFARVAFTFNNSGPGGTLAGVAFDLHVNLDHS